MDDYSSSNEDSPQQYYQGTRGGNFNKGRHNRDDELQQELLDRKFNQNQTYSGRGIVEDRQIMGG